MLKIDLHIIQKYIFGDALTEAEQTHFDREKAQNAAFQKSIADHERTVRTIRRVARQEMREKLQYFEKTGNLPKDEERPHTAFTVLRGGNWRIAVAAAASVAILATVAIWQMNDNRSLTFEKIAEGGQYRSFNYLKLATVRSKQTPPPTAQKAPLDADLAYLTEQYGAENAQKLQSAMVDLSAHRYVQAAATLDDLAFVTAHDSMRLSRADAYLGANEVDKAIADYSAVAKNETPQYKDLRMIAEWHLALAYLKKGDRTESRRRIEIIAQTTGHSCQREAKEVLEMW